MKLSHYSSVARLVLSRIEGFQKIGSEGRRGFEVNMFNCVDNHTEHILQLAKSPTSIQMSKIYKIQHQHDSHHK